MLDVNNIRIHFTCLLNLIVTTRGGSKVAATSKMERFVIIVNGWKPLTIITKRSILDVAVALDPQLIRVKKVFKNLILNWNWNFH